MTDNRIIDTIAILDAGSQFAKLIDRRVRELNVKTEILPLTTPASTLKLHEYNHRAIIISGGPGSVNEKDCMNVDPQILQMGIPILGICYGMQLLVKFYGGKVESFPHLRQDGQLEVKISSSSALYHSIPTSANVLLTHGDICTEIPDEFNCDVLSIGDIVCGISHKQLPIFGVQFHPEVTLTEIGVQMFENFIFKIAMCKPEFTIHSRIDKTIGDIKSFMSAFGNDHKVLVLLSGGVDSLVTGTLVEKALKNDYTVKLVHIDSGFMRENESNTVLQQLKSFGIDLKVYDFSREFLSAKTTVQSKITSDTSILSSNSLENIENVVPDPFQILISKATYDNNVLSQMPPILVDIGPLSSVDNPEHKRKIIGDTFMTISRKIMFDLNMDPNKTIIAQGTLRPDLIESASKVVTSHAETIKTHHNDSQKVRDLRDKGLILEPLQDFHKDEVRKLGLELNLERKAVYRHPFPGPGLAIRIICNSSPELINMETNATIQSMLNFMINYHSRRLLKRSNSMFEDIIKNNLTEQELTLIDKITSHHKDYQLLCHILPIKTVGVQGDGRSYKHPVVISSDHPNPNWTNLMELSKFMTKTCHVVNRVVYAFGGHIQDKIIDRITVCHLVPPTVDILRKADDIVTDILVKNGVYNNISQMPVILIPIEFDRNDIQQIDSIMFSIVLRPIISTDFMTGLPAVPGVHFPEHVVHDIHTNIVNCIPRISRVLYDLTSKPPGTIEWE